MFTVSWTIWCCRSTLAPFFVVYTYFVIQSCHPGANHIFSKLRGSFRVLGPPSWDNLQSWDLVDSKQQKGQSKVSQDQSHKSYNGCIWGVGCYIGALMRDARHNRQLTSMWAHPMERSTSRDPGRAKKGIPPQAPSIWRSLRVIQILNTLQVKPLSHTCFKLSTVICCNLCTSSDKHEMRILGRQTSWEH